MKIFNLACSSVLILICMQETVIADSENHLLSATTTINGLSILGSEKEIIEILGEPKSIDHGKFIPPEDLPTKIYRYDGYDVFLVKGEIYGFNCKIEECKTNRDVYYGNTMSKVIDVYGVGERTVNDTGSVVLSYKLKDVNASLMFLFNEEQVSHIRIIRHIRKK